MTSSGWDAIKLYCEYQKKPLGIQNPKPRFGWHMSSNTEAGIQAAYRVLVSDSLKLLERDIGNYWDSGLVRSGKNLCIEYNGNPLRSAEKYYWVVQLWCGSLKNHVSSRISWFETGLFSEADWQADWMGRPNPVRGVAPLFRNAFILEGKVKKARIYISGIGYYRLYLNGKRVGDRELEPGWTDYGKSILYSVYNVTPMLTHGENTVGIELGEGWYGHEHPSFTHFMNAQPRWLGSPRVLFRMEAELKDGRKVILCSGENKGWLCCDGPIRRNSIYDGETYDAQKEIAGWNEGINDPPAKGWREVCTAASPGGRLVAQMMPPVRRTAIMPSTAVNRINGRKLVFDLGRNISGRVRVVLKGRRRNKVTIAYAETLNADGTVNQKNLRRALARDEYIFKGTGYEEYEPAFTYHGFRYVQLEAECAIEVKELLGVVLHSDVRRTGYIKTSDDILEKIYDMTLSTEKYNLHSIPTDCPQRDERMAWLNDMTVRGEQAVYHFDMMLFYEKWLNDIADAQDPETGSIPDTAPYIYGGGPAFHVSSSFVMIPWLLYRFYGDVQVLERLYDKLKKYVFFLRSQCRSGLIDKKYYGDWAPPKAECELGHSWDAVPANTPHQLISTGYYYYDCVLMRQISHRLGRYQDVTVFESMGNDAKQALNKAFFDADPGFYQPGNQASNVFPLFLGIVPDGYSERVKEHLVQDIVRKQKLHLTTGNQTTKYIFSVLGDGDGPDIAVDLLRQSTYPSIGYMISRGATTIWERWEEETGPGMNSHNHPMNAAFASWFYSSLGGIKLLDSGMEDGKLFIEPNLSQRLSFAKVCYHSIRGKISVKWEASEQQISIRTEIPWNTTAQLSVPLPSDWVCPAVILDDMELFKADDAAGKEGRLKIELSSGFHKLDLKILKE